MTTITRAQIRTGARLHADFPNSNQGKLDTELNTLIDDCCAEYYDLLVACRGHDYFLSSATLSLVNGTAGYSLGSTVYQLGMVTLEWASDDHEIVPALNARDTPHFTNLVTWNRGVQKGYRLSGTQAGVRTLTFYPTPTSAVTARYRFIPVYSAFPDDATGLECENSWAKLVKLSVAIEFRGLLGLPTDHLERKRAEQLQRVQEMATERLQDEPLRVVDVNPEAAGTWFPRQRWYRS